MTDSISLIPMATSSSSYEARPLRFPPGEDGRDTMKQLLHATELLHAKNVLVPMLPSWT